MPFKTVFIAVGAGQDDRQIDRAAAISGALDAHLVVLVLGVAPPPPASPYGVVSNDIWASEIRDGQAMAQARAGEIAQRLHAAGVPATVDAQYIDRGTVATLAARCARYADLTLIPPSGADGEALQTWVLNGALFESGRPVLLLPEGDAGFPQPKRVLVAWDASVEASTAVHHAIELMSAAEGVDVVLIDPVPSFEGHGPEPGADLGAYLARHGITTTIHRLPREGHEISEILRRTAVDLGAELIVMGGFGHSRLRQRIFGGTTTEIIQDAPVPVLMAH